MVWKKMGVMGTLTTPAQKALGRIAVLYEKKGFDLYITSLMEGNHMPGSLHYNGNAFDFERIKDISKIQIQVAVGKGFDVVEYDMHFHCEYDPK
jgi:hypothetical protein